MKPQYYVNLIRVVKYISHTLICRKRNWDTKELP